MNEIIRWWEGMNMLEALREKKIGVDGLCNPEIECGCGLRNLVPCGAVDVDDCVAAKRKGDLYYPMEAH